MAGYLPFGLLSGSGQSYGKDFDSALQLNAQNYQNIYGGYGDLLAQQQNANQALESGYSNRAQNAMNLLAGMEESQRQDIQAGATRASASNAQDLIGRGLSNTTVQNSLARGVESDKNRAVNNLVGQMAGLKSSTYAALTGDKLAAMGRNRDAANDIARQRLAFQERVSAPYPDSSKYAALAQQAGANQMAGMGMQGGGMRQPGGGGPRNNGGFLRNPGANAGQAGAAGGGVQVPWLQMGQNPFGGGPLAGPDFGGAGGGMPPGGGFPGGIPQQMPGYGCPNGDCSGSWDATIPPLDFGGSSGGYSPSSFGGGFGTPAAGSYGGSYGAPLTGPGASPTPSTNYGFGISGYAPYTAGGPSINAPFGPAATDADYYSGAAQYYGGSFSPWG